MLTKLQLKQFKNFKDASLALGPLTILVGTNASGKSNVRDAVRFLHGIGRGYRLAEIIGEKWGEGGVLQWRGIRGGTREAGFASSRDLIEAPAEGRSILAREAAGRYDRIRQLCPEVAALESRIGQWL
jgi:predicted ATPase